MDSLIDTLVTLKERVSSIALVVHQDGGSLTYFLASILFKWSDNAATKMIGRELLLVACDPWWGMMTVT